MQQQQPRSAGDSTNTSPDVWVQLCFFLCCVLFLFFWDGQIFTHMKTAWRSSVSGRGHLNITEVSFPQMSLQMKPRPFSDNNNRLCCLETKYQQRIHKNWSYFNLSKRQGCNLKTQMQSQPSLAMLLIYNNTSWGAFIHSGGWNKESEDQVISMLTSIRRPHQLSRYKVAIIVETLMLILPSVR